MMPLPLDRHDVRDFADGLDDVLVIEEKNATLELLVRDALYDVAERPRVWGKRDADGQVVVPYHGLLDADRILPALRLHLGARLADRLAPGAPAPRPQPDPAQRRPRPVLLLRVPAQHQHPGRAGHARRRRHRLPRDGRTDGPRSSGRRGRPHVHGQRGRAMDRHGARSSSASTSSRTSATAPTSTPVRWRSGRRSRPASTSPTSCSTTARWR